MTDPTVLITGANSGVGFAAAQVLAQRGARVLMLCRDRGRGEDARAQLRTSERGHQFFKAYQRSKLCNILFAFELSRRLQGTSATSNAVSPGPSRTRFGDNMTGAAGVLPKVMKRMPVFGSPEKGAQTLVYAATAAELDGVSGRFFFKSKEYETKPVTHDRELAVRLWRHSEQLCGLVPALEGAERSA
jgi:NAD(P)-dependent dehydrogenase (short-subunit alcohol dehydrogenase family)